MTAEQSPPAKYVCDFHCACCKLQLTRECDDLDVLRDPRLIDVDQHHRGKSVDHMACGQFVLSAFCQVFR